MWRWLGTIVAATVAVALLVRDVAIAQYAILPPPTELRATAEGPTSIRLTWRDNATSENRYRVEWKANGTGHHSYLVDLPADTQSFLHERLSPGAYFCYYVAARDSSENYGVAERAGPYSHCAWVGGAPPGLGRSNPAAGSGPSDPATLWVGSAGSASPPEARTDIADPRSAASGYGFSGVARGDGTVWTWGDSGSQGLGYESSPCPSGSCANPTVVPGMTGVQQVIAAGGGMLAVDTAGNVWAWGRSDFGALAYGTKHPQNARIHRVDAVTGATAVASHGSHTLALTSTGEVWAWGAFDCGQVGDGSSLSWPYTSPPVRARISGATAIAAGGGHSLALTGDGTVWAWGLNSSGQLGVTSTESCSYQLSPPAATRIPVLVPGLPSIVQVAAGSLHSLALDRDGAVWAWGYNAEQQTGRPGGDCHPNIVCRREPMIVPGLPPASAVVGSGGASFAIAADGSLWGWGYNGDWKLGPPSAACGETPCEPVPVRVGAFRAVRSIAPGGGMFLTIAAPALDSTDPALRYRVMLPIGR